MAQSTRTVVAAKAKLEAKALACPSKSEGMRTLFDADYTVTQVTRVFGVGYAFAYGVAKRAGKAETAAARRPIKAVKTAKAVVTTVKKVASATKPATARTTKAAITSKPATTKPAPRAAKVAMKPGRPTAARRAANRKASTRA